MTQQSVWDPPLTEAIEWDPPATPAGLFDLPPPVEFEAEVLSQPTRHSVGRNFGALMTSQVLTWTLSLLLTTIVARRLGPEGSGQLRLASSIWGVVGVFVYFGTSTLVTMDLARTGRKSAFLHRAMGLQLTIGVIGIVVAGIFTVLAGYPGDTTLIIAISAIAVFPTAISGTARAAFQGLEQMSKPSFVDVLTRLTLTILTITVVLLGLGVTAVAVVNVAIVMIGATAMVVLLRRDTGLTPIPAFNGLLAVAKLGVPFLVLEATVIVYQQVDTLVMSFLVGETELGWYSAASTVFGTLLFIPTVLMTSLFPVAARLANTDPDAFLRLIRRSLRFLLLACVPLGLGTLALARPVSVLLFGSEFAESGPVLALYGLLVIVLSPVIVLSYHAIVTGQQRRWAVFMIIGIVLTVPLDMILVPWCDHHFGNGAIAGAISYLITEIVSLCLAMRITARGVVNSSVVRRAVTALAVGLVMLAVVWPLRDAFIAIPILVGVGVYAAGIFVSRTLDDEERAIIGRFARRLLPSGRS